MADVYRGTDELLDREVAVKLMRGVEPRGAAHARFLSEARTLAGLSHPGLVAVLDVGTSEDRPFLVLELVEGGTLARRCTRQALDPGRVVDIGRQIAEALACVHAAGVVHRDVKPSNVLAGHDGRVRLTDFGIARPVGDPAWHTGTDELVGTAAYLAPEQVRGGVVTPASDVYSLGLVLLEAATGRRTYPGPPIEAALARLRGSPAIPVSLPVRLQRLLRAMTEDDPASRPSAAEVARRLGTNTPEAVGRLPDATPWQGGFVPSTTGQRRSGRRHRRARPAWLPALSRG
jgi:serine/threonine protein kinase